MGSEGNVDITPEYHTTKNKLKKHWNHDEMESETAIQVESGAFTHFECGDAACFPVHN